MESQITPLTQRSFSVFELARAFETRLQTQVGVVEKQQTDALLMEVARDALQASQIPRGALAVARTMAKAGSGLV